MRMASIYLKEKMSVDIHFYFKIIGVGFAIPIRYFWMEKCSFMLGVQAQQLKVVLKLF
jgi:hypothetical protein